ncbi:MAG: transcription antitermination factor NusB [Thermodesulfobacteriota bacterium]
MERTQAKNRHKARERAFQILYGWSFSRNREQDHIQRTFDNFAGEQFEDNQEANEYAWQLICGVERELQTLDRIIAAHSRNWRLERIAKVEITILRLSLYEMLFGSDVPVKVAINEGIELSKKFGDRKSNKFVNGILDAIGRKWKEHESLSILKGEPEAS